MFHPREAPEDEAERRRHRPTITQALDMWGSWHADCSPLGCTGDYALDMQLADAFRALLYRPALKDRLEWIERECWNCGHRQHDHRYFAEIIRWWLAIWEAEKAPVVANRMHERALQCASC
jgi:hypothetical protein